MNALFPLDRHEGATTLDPVKTGYSVLGCGPWIPMVPGSQDGPDLEGQWEGEEDDDVDDS
jgi:hypothetical protein